MNCLMEELPDLSPLVIDPIRHIAIVVYSFIAIGALLSAIVFVFLYLMGGLKMKTKNKQNLELQREREKILAKIDKIQDIMASGGDIKQNEKELDKYIERIHEIDAKLWRDLNEYLGE